MRKYFQCEAFKYNQFFYTLVELSGSMNSSVLISVELFRDNHSKLNASKCHLIVSGYKYELMLAKVGDALLRKGNLVKLLGLSIASDL